MLHRFALPLPWGALSVLDLVEPVRETESGKYFRHCLYVVDMFSDGGKRLIKQGPEFLIPVPPPIEGPVP
jgi:hypothetical protein